MAISGCQFSAKNVTVQLENRGDEEANIGGWKIKVYEESFTFWQRKLLAVIKIKSGKKLKHNHSVYLLNIGMYRLVNFYRDKEKFRSNSIFNN